MKKKFLSLIVALALLLSMATAMAYAGEVPQPGGTEAETNDEAVTPKVTGLVSFHTNRISNTSASASVIVDFSRRADSYTVAIILQKKSGGSWVTATDVYGSAHYYRGTNEYTVVTSDSWNVKSGVVYRIKCVSTDSYDNGSKYTTTTYSNSF